MIKCQKCGVDAAFPSAVTEPYICLTCQDREIEIEKLYQTRLNRMQKLISLNAPRQIIANEALLVAIVVLSPDMTAKGLIPIILTEHGSKPENG